MFWVLALLPSSDKEAPKVMDPLDRPILSHWDMFHSINSECYIATHKTLKQWLRRVWKHKKNILLRHDNATPHTLQTRMEAIEKLHLTILPHLPYSPDLVPCNFHLFFQKWRKTFVDICMAQIKRWKGLSGRGWRNKACRKNFQKLVHRWWKCVENGGDYIQK
jgi:hypothetical protein